MRSPRPVLVPVLLAAQALFVLFGSPGEYRPAAPRLENVPRHLPGWTALYDTEIPREVLGELGADATLSRYYADAGGGGMVHLLVVWFQTQQGGRQPHSPKVCLPGSGWEPVSTGTVRVRDAVINRYVAVSGAERAVVLYWYQTPARAIAGEWEAKFWLMVDGMRYHRTDAAIVRVTAPVINGNEEAASKCALRFSEMAYPLMRQTLPHL
jgi:EpsI family protein